MSLSASTVFSRVNEMRYLGIVIVHSRIFKCSLEHAKSHFIAAVFAKIRRVAFEEVTLQLIKSNDLRTNISYGLETRSITKSDLQSLDFVINRFFVKLFTIKSI